MRESWAQMVTLMLKLTKVERDFLKEHGILESELFDARDMGGPEFNPIMKELGIEFAVGRSCKNAGHRLRTRSNHCVQCDTARISFQRRWNSDGDVYVAHSPSRKLIKVGTADCPYSRTDSLNSYKYGVLQIGQLHMRYILKMLAGLNTQHRLHSRGTEQMLHTTKME